jgi:hypothetical protein
VIRDQWAAPSFIEIFGSGSCMASSARCGRRADHADREHDVLNAQRNQRAEE